MQGAYAKRHRLIRRIASRLLPYFLLAIVLLMLLDLLTCGF
jgi:hypothetical protein